MAQRVSEERWLDFGSEGAESEEVSGLPLEEVELSEQPSEGVSGESQNGRSVR